MSTSIPAQRTMVSDVLADLEAVERFDTPTASRPRVARRWWLRIVLTVCFATVVVVGFASWLGGASAKSRLPLQTHVAQRSELLVTLTEDGNVESADNLDIKCEVAGGSTILWIIDDGQNVQQGDLLVRLESSQLEEQISLQKILYEKARASRIQADRDFESAKISVQEYLEGTFRQSLQDFESKITIAMANLRSAENSLEHTERMFRKGYVSPLQLEAQQFAVERAKLDLASAKTAKDVLERFTKPKMLTSLQAQQAATEAKKNSENASFELEEARLHRLEGYLKKCRISAPKAGMAVYANDSRGRWGSQQSEIKEGAQVRDQQNILRLPDLSKMQVKVTVHESKVERIQRDMRARIRIQDREFQGCVITVGTQPEPTSWFSASVKEYATIVKIDGESKHLLPGMTAEVEILVAHLNNVIVVPVAAVFELAGHTFCYVKSGDKVDRRAVEVGQSNDKLVELKSGVTEGETVVLNPRTLLTDIHEEEGGKAKVDVKKRFGDAPPGDKKKPEGAAKREGDHGPPPGAAPSAKPPERATGAAANDKPPPSPKPAETKPAAASAAEPAKK